MDHPHMLWFNMYNGPKHAYPKEEIQLGLSKIFYISGIITWDLDSLAIFAVKASF